MSYSIRPARLSQSSDSTRQWTRPAMLTKWKQFSGSVLFLKLAVCARWGLAGCVFVCYWTVNNLYRIVGLSLLLPVVCQQAERGATHSSTYWGNAVLLWTLHATFLQRRRLAQTQIETSQLSEYRHFHWLFMTLYVRQRRFCRRRKTILKLDHL